MEDCIDFFFTLLDKNKFILVLELDYSQANKWYWEDAFIPSNFNLYPGGSVPIVWSIVAEKNSISPYNHACTVQSSTIMHYTFTINDPSPKGKEKCLSLINMMVKRVWYWYKGPKRNAKTTWITN